MNVHNHLLWANHFIWANIEHETSVIYSLDPGLPFGITDLTMTSCPITSQVFQRGMLLKIHFHPNRRGFLAKLNPQKFL